MQRGATWALAALLVAVAAAGAWLLRAPDAPAPQVASTAPPASAVASAPPGTVDDRLCADCHRGAAQQWSASHHAMAMALPTVQTVRGDFGNASFAHQGVTTRFFRRDGRYFVNTDGPDGKMADFEIAYTFGVDPLQQYLIALPGGRLQALAIAWDTRRKRWFHLYPREKAPPGDVMHWTGRYQTANTMCIECHTTGYEKRYDAQADRFDSRWTALNVGCQACHGPGEAHVAWARQSTGRAAAASAAAPPPIGPTASRYGLVMDFAARDAKGEVEVCAACHSRRSSLGTPPIAGDPLLDHFLPARLEAGLYHADGQQLGEVYAYGSFVQSRMHQLGVRCTDCHGAHTGKLKAEGNGVCAQCHGAALNPRFPTAARDLDTPAHHHHAPGSAGAQCVACHMPSTNYMVVHARPDHSIRIPRPDLDAATGAPDACTACHRDRKPAWAAAAIERWFGPKRRAHYGPVLAAARSGLPGAELALATLAAEPGTAPIVRATALAALRAYPGGPNDVRLQATRDPDAQVRAAAADSLETLPAPQRLRALVPLLSDPVRAVRIGAARSLSPLAGAGLDAAQRKAFDAALAEAIAAQNAALDMPGARLNLAVIEENIGQPEQAEANYLAALRIDPDFTPARANLARFYSARGRPEDAERVLVDGLARVPRQGELQYSLGLILAEQGRIPEAAAALGRAAALLPGRARVRYNLGLALQQSGRRREAERAFAEAQRIDPRDPAIPYALAALYAQDGRWNDAIGAAEQLRRLSPNDPQVDQFVRQLRANARRAQ